MKIGVFDSGVGGAAVAATLRQLIPEAEVITADDHRNVPYGSRTDQEVYRLTRAAIQPLLEQGCEVIVLACNTATAAAIDQLRSDYPQTPFVGLEPMVKPASAMTRTGAVVVCATEATLRSERYRRLKETWAEGVTVLEPDCSEWASAIQAGGSASVDLEPLREMVREHGADVVVLACTHYHWLKLRVEETLGEHVAVLEPSDAVASQILRVLGADLPS
ncbi:glutamate racemase [Nesterenkonia flava]|uniref:Aspartate/glutamate racemase family protein n=1 Tax=Nesterenkonia flava TaxID=469799 RepID=A0ABU1FTI6_9MICC|nr:aspartate/glutamate racemase family protein [Nesterenkonia flava]MDR5711949.1 aspartate/glutamate racemase family protein [Nesterenkonia flava]